MIRINLLPVTETARVAGRRQDIALGVQGAAGLHRVRASLTDKPAIVPNAAHGDTSTCVAIGLMPKSAWRFVPVASMRGVAVSRSRAMTSATLRSGS